MVLPVNEQIAVAPYNELMVSRVTVLAATLNAGAAFDLFEITGGPILVEALFGHVTTLTGAGALLLRLAHTPDIAIYPGTGLVNICAAAGTIATDPVDTLYIWDGLNGDAIDPTTAVGICDTTENAWMGSGGPLILIEGVISQTSAVACNAGEIDFYMLWRAQVANSRVIAQ